MTECHVDLEECWKADQFDGHVTGSDPVEPPPFLESVFMFAVVAITLAVIVTSLLGI